MKILPLSPKKMPPILRRSEWTRWFLVAAVYTVGCLMHLRFSLWLVRTRETAFGSLSYAQLVPAVAVVAAIALAIGIAMQLRRSPRPWLTGGYWLAWVAAVATADRYLTFSLNELAHYPQYALVAWLLARAMDPGRTRWHVGRLLFWTTLLGAGDELLQYLWITSSYSDYFDFNDCLVNLLGAAAGLLLYYGAAALPSPDSERTPPRVEAAAVGILAFAVAAFLNSGLVVLSPAAAVVVPPGGTVRQSDGSWRLYLQRGPRFHGSWQGGQRHAKYYVLPPVAGLGFMLAAGLVFAGFGSRRGALARPTLRSGA